MKQLTIAASCGIPPKVPHASHNGSAAVFSTDDSVVYTCDVGYAMMDSRDMEAVVRCQSDGSWQQTPVCVGQLYLSFFFFNGLS